MNTNNSMQIFWVVTLLLMLLILVLVNVNQSFYDYLYLQVFRKLPNEQTSLTVSTTDEIKNAQNNNPKDNLDSVIDSLLLDSEKRTLKEYTLYYINENNIYSFNTEANTFAPINYANVENKMLKKISRKNINTFYVLECEEDLLCDIAEFNIESLTKQIIETNVIDFTNRINDIAILKINQSPQDLSAETVNLNPERDVRLIVNGIEINKYLYLQSQILSNFSINNIYITENNEYVIYNNPTDSSIFIYNTKNKSSRTLDNYKVMGSVGNLLILIDNKNQFYTYNVTNDLLKINTQITDLSITIDNNKTVYNDTEFTIHNPGKFNSYVYIRDRDIINILDGFYPLHIIDNNLIGIKHDCLENCFSGNEILTSNSKVQIVNLGNFETKNLNIPISSIVNFQVIAYEL